MLLGAFLVVDLGRANLPWIIYLDVPLKYATNPVIERLSEKPYEQRVAIMPGWMHQMLRAPAELGILDQLYRIEWAQHHFFYYNIQSLDIVQMPRVPEDMEAFEGVFRPKMTTDLPLLLTPALAAHQYPLPAGPRPITCRSSTSNWIPPSSDSGSPNVSISSANRDLHGPRDWRN